MLFLSALLPSVGLLTVSGWVLDDTREQGFVPGTAAAAPGPGYFPPHSSPGRTEIRAEGRCHRRWGISDNCPS